MSPVARRQGGAHTGRAVLVAVAGVAIALGVAFGVATLASRGDVQVNLGEDRFVAGDAENILEDIRERGAPLGFNDPARFQRPIWVDNGGDDPETGWIAVGAFLPENPRCLVQWDADRELFVVQAAPESADHECDTSITFPRSGAGLRQYATNVVDGKLRINLQDRDRSAD